MSPTEIVDLIRGLATREQAEERRASKRLPTPPDPSVNVFIEYDLSRDQAAEILRDHMGVKP